MSNAAKKASFKRILLGLASGFLKMGLIITVIVYTVNTFYLKNVGISAMVIASLAGTIIYLIIIIRSTTLANRHEHPEAALKDSMGDLFLLPILLTIALIWTFLPNFSGMRVTHGSYYVTLVFFWAMFALCWVEAVLTISNSLYQMYRVQQITTESR